MPNGRLWIWKPFLPFHISSLQDERIVLTDNYVGHPDDKRILVSDASVHVADAKVAWA